MEKNYISDDDFSYDEEGFKDEWFNVTDEFAASARKDYFTVAVNYAKRYILNIIPAYLSTKENSRFHIVEEGFSVKHGNYFYLSIREIAEKYDFNLLELNLKINEAMKDT